MLLFCIDFPKVYLKRSKSNPDAHRKCCLFDFGGTAQSEKRRTIFKSDQQTLHKKETLFNPEILSLSKLK